MFSTLSPRILSDRVEEAELVGGRNQQDIPTQSLVVRSVWAIVGLGQLFSLGQYLPPRWLAVDLYVILAALIGSIGYVIAIFYADILPAGFIFILCAIGVLRLNEIICVHLIVILKLQKVHSPQRSLLLVLINYGEVVIWFASFYALMSNKGLLTTSAPSSVAIIRESLALMLSSSVGTIQLTAAHLPWLVMTVHSIFGLFMTVIVMSRFVSMLPNPGSHYTGD
jgi:hypothetical protein